LFYLPNRGDKLKTVSVSIVPVLVGDRVSVSLENMMHEPAVKPRINTKTPSTGE
jgi:hypothetical protein